MYNKNYRQKDNRKQNRPQIKISPEVAKRNKKIMAKVEEWQNFKYIKHLMCNNESCGTKLKAKEVNGRVILQCPKCREIQSYIPKSVLQTKFYMSTTLTRLQHLYQGFLDFLE